VTLGDYLRFYHDNSTSMENVEGFMAGSYGPCRLGKYAVEQIRLLKDVGFELPIRTTVSNNAYRDLNLGNAFERLAWKGVIAFDCLEKLLWRTRPYEKDAGSADALFTQFCRIVADRVRNKEIDEDIVRRATAEFGRLLDPNIPRKPLIGINGEIFLRSNRFSNKDLVRECESAGLEVVVSPMGEWLKYTSYRNLEDAIRDRNLKKMFASYLKKVIQERDERAIAVHYHEMSDEEELSIPELLAYSGKYLSPRCGSEAVLSIGSGVEWMKNPRFTGVISVMPHGCMPGGIVAAMSEKLSSAYKKPWISLTYDGFIESNNLSKINDFAEIVRFCSQ